MRKIRSRISIRLAALFFGVAFFADPGNVNAAALTSENVVTLINQSRAEAGISALTANAKLTDAAQAKANDMFEQQYFAHVGPDGRGPENWIDEAGYNWTYIGENIAYGYTSAESVHSAFMASQGHRDNILGADYEHVGVAAISGQYNGQTVIMVVEEFGATNDVEETTYSLTVTNGTGDGSYATGQTITIRANAPVAGQVFDKWTGDISYISSITSSTTTVTIPNKAIVVTATYKASAPTVYVLTVSGGAGSGSYVSGSSVTITAAAPASGKIFDKWTGSTSYVASITSATTTVTMPASAITLTATYKNAPVYALAVTSGTGSGSYVEGKQVSITANAPTAGQVFDKWTGSTTYISDVSASTTTVTMPASPITLTATYKILTINTYPLTISSGTGSTTCAAGTKVTITANSAPTGKVFSKWTGDTTYLSSVYTSTSTVTMPSKAILLTATYKDITATTYKLTVSYGSGSGSYIAGTDVTIAANPPVTGKIFSKWTGSTSYVANITSSTTKVTMPATAISITATYVTAPITKYTLTVTSGSGSGSYAAGTDVNIRASNAPADKVFDQWTGDTNYVLNPKLSYTKVTVPEQNINLTATYKNKTAAYPNGTLIKLLNSPKVYVVIDGDKKWISTPEVFEQLGYKWTLIKIISEEDLNSYPDFEDNLIRVTKGYKVYLVVNGVKRHIPNPEIFLNYGFDWNDVKDVEQSVMDKYKETYLIRASKTTSIYYLTSSGIKKLIPTVEIFNSYNDNWNDVQIISQTEMNAYPVANLIKLGTSQDVYLIEGTVKRRIPSIAIFDKYKFNWSYVISVNQTEFNYYQMGAEVR